ncbi:hypothetical protein [Bacillus sinesaloumensis]|nr:hypothetical protein [Bacillus sinesaloumensis]
MEEVIIRWMKTCMGEFVVGRGLHMVNEDLNGGTGSMKRSS